MQLMLKRAVLPYVCAVDVEKGCCMSCAAMLKRAVLLCVCAVDVEKGSCMSCAADVEKGCSVVCLCS